MAQFDPPKWADRFIEKVCPEQYLEKVQGDLHEAFHQAAGVHSHIGDSCPRVECSINGRKGEMEYMIVGEDYLDLMEIQTIQGRGFNALKQTDYETALLVNEKFIADFLPNKNPLGQKVVFSDTINCIIIGVVNNFMQDGFHDPLRPLVLRLGKPDQFEYLAVKTVLENNQEVQAILKSTWEENFPMKPFEHYFQDDFLATSIQQTNNVKWFMSIIAIITLFLTMTGLFALISLKILKQSKEIAIRRVLGASVASISFLLNKNYIWVISTGIVFGCTLGAWFSFQMLNNIYNIHAGISHSLLILAAIITLAILLLTIAIKIVGLIKTNPVAVLKQ